MSDPRDEARVLSAAEYVLGVTSAAERAEASARMTQDPEFAADVTEWDARLFPLSDEIAPVAPSAQVWAALDQATRPGVGLATRVARPQVAGFWRAWAIGATALAAACVGLVIYSGLRGAGQGHQMVAKVMTTTGAPDLVLAYDTSTRTLVATPLGPRPPRGMAPRLWLTHADGTLTPLGDVDMAQPRRKRLNAAQARELEAANGAVISIESAEQPAGARPSGPLVAAGNFSRV